MPFKKASRKSVPLHMMIGAVPGGGKTHSALRLATGLAGDRGRVAMIDGEQGRSEMFGERIDFDYQSVSHNPREVITKINEAVSDGYAVAVYDGSAGTWDYVKKAVGTQKNEFGVWERTRVAIGFEDMLDLFENCPIDLIVTCMLEEKYEIGTNEKTGKTEMKRLGAGPLQCKEFKGKFDIIFELDADSHMATANKKNRTELWLDGVPFLITEDHGALLGKWRNEGGEFKPPLTAATKTAINKYSKALAKDSPTDIPSEEAGLLILSELKSEYNTKAKAKETISA